MGAPQRRGGVFLKQCIIGVLTKLNASEEMKLYICLEQLKEK